MSFFRLKHVFAGLMTLGAVTAFVVPQRILQAHVPAVDALFVPVSRPSGAIARWAHNSFAAPELSIDNRDADVVRRENERLKNEVITLTTRVEALEEAEYHRKLVGPIRDYCTPFPVASTDSGTRASLGIQGTSWQGLRDGMVALYAEGIVGRVERAGIAGARVRLVTDSGFRIRVGFVRFDGAKFIRLNPLASVTEGTGKGAMRITLLSREEAAGLVKGDWVTLNDPEWPPYLQGRALGQIISIGARRDAPLFAEIVVEPSQNLLRLTEVLIVTKDPTKRGNAE